VQAAYEWIMANYTLDENPGAKHNQGLFYYYNAFAKSMAAYGEAEVTDSNGVKHNWRDDLTRKLLALQSDDGSWVNTDSPRWWEGNKQLVTAWSVIALDLVVRYKRPTPRACAASTGCCCLPASPCPRREAPN
jgi:squalene-hopene/tetraprenyl-beta-curcumene cyclase